VPGDDAWSNFGPRVGAERECVLQSDNRPKDVHALDDLLKEAPVALITHDATKEAIVTVPPKALGHDMLS